MAQSGVVVRNTFLEVGDQMPSLHDWRRQISEPVKIYTTNSDEEDDLPEDGAEAPEQMPMPAFSMGSRPTTLQPAIPPPGAIPSTPDFEASPPPFVPVPMPVQRPAVPQQGKVSRSGVGINALKNNDITNKEPPWNDVTTVMMRNLPNKYRQQMLLDELADAGFRVQSDFDFFYLPMDHSNAANLGYCFINFTEPALANSFASAFMGKKMRRFNSHKTVVVMPASIQGYDRNYKYYSSTRVAQAEDLAYRPLFLRHPDPDAQDRKGGRGKGEKGKGKKGKGKGAQDGKGVEAFSRLAFMGLEEPNQGEWPMQEQMPWQPPQMMQAPFPGGCGMASPMGCAGCGCPPRSGNMVTCVNCGNMCSADHRFCSACGAPVPKPAGGNNGMGKGCAGPAGQPVNGMMACPMMMSCGCAPCGPMGCMNMRADAPTFMPYTEAPEDEAPSHTPRQLTDPVSNELDVMRGRLMLIAALKDIEQRDGSGAGKEENVAWLA